MRAGFERLDVGCWMSDDGEQLTEEKAVDSGPRTSFIQHPTSNLPKPPLLRYLPKTPLYLRHLQNPGFPDIAPVQRG